MFFRQAVTEQLDKIALSCLLQPVHGLVAGGLCAA